ncbi:MAG TPA: proton-conducting transporter membrane subunit [Verrucomicrobiae bacterium]|nr:proton-conducting transporter membrane subunit [Verrucomicrobiae bacterium]
MNPGPLLLLAVVCLAAGIVTGSRYARTWLGFVLTGTVAGLVASLSVLGGGADWDWRSEFLVGGEALHFRLDGVSALFLVLLSVVGGAGAAYAREYWSDEHYPVAAPRGRAWWSALLLCMSLVLLSSNGLHFLIAWELFTVCAFFLLTLDRQRLEVRRTGWLYLAASHGGTVCLFAFFGTLAARTGSWEIGPWRERAEFQPLFWLALAGFGVKAGLFPLHIWLPSAHANAPSHVSALMSGVAIKMGVYGLVRFSGWLPVPMAAGWTLLLLGSASASFGIAFALAQNDLKRLLAYCSVENIGIILAGLGTALLGAAHGHAAWGRLALAGALLHVWNHGAFKSLLFFGAGSVLHATGTREMSRLGGLWRAMPWTASLFALGCLAVAGLPPLNGFVSEWLIYLGLFDVATQRGGLLGAAMPAAILLAMAGALALACFVKAVAVVFLGVPRTHAAKHAHECGAWMRGPMLTLAGACLLAGLAPMIFWPAIASAVSAWDPAWATGEPPAPLSALGAVQITLVCVAVALALGLWKKVHTNGLRRALTWDCGYAEPTARMQYTSGSFAGLATAWFTWLLRPERVSHRPRGLLPARASRFERVPETVLEHVLIPAAALILHVSTATRRLQHGRLSAYILYVVAGLLSLSLFVLLGGKP